MSKYLKINDKIIYETKGTTPKYTAKSNTIVLNQKCIRDGVIDYSFAQFISDEQKIVKEKYVRLGDVLLNSTGQGTAGRCAFVDYIPKDYKVTIDSHMLILRFEDKKIAKFFAYSLYNQEKYILELLTGSSGQGELDREIVYNISFPFEEKNLDMFNKILITINNKIKVNNKINSELEKMAKTLYNYWFVQFDFPDGNKRPYKSSGGKMVYNPILKRYIPIGWEVKSLSDIANIIMGQSPRGNSYNTIGKGMPFHQGCANFGDKFPIAKQYTTEPNRIANIGDFLISIRAPVGCLNIAIEECCIGRGLVAIHSKTNNNEYLYQILQNLKKQFELRNSMGTTFGSITKDDLFGLIVIKPKDNVLKSYKKICQNISLKQYNLFLENVKLTKIRDFLLPMLMNGQVTIQH